MGLNTRTLETNRKVPKILLGVPWSAGGTH
jgi:hypothetical protein